MTRTITPPDWTEPFARTIDAMKKYVVSNTLDRVDWNAERVSGNLGEAVRKLKQQPGRALYGRRKSCRWRWRSWA